MEAVDVLTFGESMGSFRHAGLLRMGGSAQLCLAGAESNVAIGLSRLGHTTRWAGRLGQDEIGAFALRQLRAEGVLTDAVSHDEHRPTGLMLLEQRTADLARVQYYRAGSAGAALTIDLVRPAIAAGARILHLTGITPALSASAAEAVLWAARAARDAGILVSFDVNFRAKLWTAEQAAETLPAIAACADVVIASEDELALAVPEAHDGEVAAAAALADKGVGQVIIKRGADGATGWIDGQPRHVAAHKVVVRDTVGAGDAFTAGYLSGLLDGLDVQARLERGAILGAFAVGYPGDWEALPTRAELRLWEQQAGTTVR
ncbi:sugar kinase [Arthrobacter crystallopoietes]|uniref:2-dehydro-3-deoxygluconokinase n=1 Tax=Crystallibacter crystallopoietes TaxID=37928 RepID=A0A1H1B5P9_9MICC|nr:sugar kinase [Arthrobacter crystallopoietes]SDQ47213.1 2-dehydro-3-deoxygluconokinase [Arthrobacter crystallopoietes]